MASVSYLELVKMNNKGGSHENLGMQGVDEYMKALEVI